MNSHVPESTSEVTLRATVLGRVQGVGFRLFVHDMASQLGLRGYVRNMNDGSVYVTAVGPRPTLEELLALLRRGPGGARVASVQHEWSTTDTYGVGPGFEVRP